MPTDPATGYAIDIMEARPPLHPPVRLVQQWLPVSDHPQISHVGMSDLSNRGEVRSHGSDALSAVTDVTGDYIDAFQGAADQPADGSERR